MAEQDKSGYIQFVRDALDLYPDEEVVRQRIATIKAVGAHRGKDYADTPPFPIPSSEEILDEWNRDGRKRKLREQLELTQENPDRLGRLTLVIDELIAALPDPMGNKIRDYYHFNEPGTEVPISTRGRHAWLSSTPMRHVRRPAAKIGSHLSTESQGRLPLEI